jgi:uncharacterized protein YndB with AHSA1/START domain
MTPSDDDRRERRIELEVEVPGTPEEVWAAIATGPGISAWMHPTTVEEREGGALSFDMGAGPSPGTVTGWDPPRRFAQEAPWPPGDEASPVRLATEWRIEARAGGTCVVRMVMSGFATGGGWDDEVDGMREGLQSALEMLRVHLTHFPGRRGSWIRAFAAPSGPPDAVWARLTAALGLADGAAGARVTASDPDGPGLAGVVEHASGGAHRRDLLLRLEAPAPGLAALSVYGEAGAASLQACLYGDESAAVAAAQEPAWRTWLEARIDPNASERTRA